MSVEPAFSGGVLSAPYVLEYPYRRSLGPVIGRFLAALKDGKILGIKTTGAIPRVIVPPTEYDPETGAENGALVEVGPAGAVMSWAWVQTPRKSHPLERPFAFALIRLDGADTSLLHAVDAGAESAMKTGMRVAPRFRVERSGSVLDIECFVSVESRP